MSDNRSCIETGQVASLKNHVTVTKIVNAVRSFFVIVRVVTALACFVVSTFASLAEASPECGQIEDSLRRLNCYDTLYRSDSATEMMSVEDAWEKFNELTKADKPGLISHAALDDCRFYFREFEIDVDRYAGTAGSILQIELPLTAVDVSNSGHDDWSGSTKITMARDSLISHSSYRATAGFQARFDWNMPLIPPPSSEWQTEISSEMHLRTMYPTDRNGNIGFRFENSRSVTWNFAKAWPDDSRDISDAFINLVKACQR